MIERDIPLICINEVVETLRDHPNDFALAFASGLTGLSEDKLMELMDEANGKGGTQ